MVIWPRGHHHRGETCWRRNRYTGTLSNLRNWLGHRHEIEPSPRDADSFADGRLHFGFDALHVADKLHQGRDALPRTPCRELQNGGAPGD